MREIGTTIVTGGASGLGAATTQAISEQGGTPVVLDRRHPGNGTAFEEVDLSDRRAVERAVSHVVEKHGRIDAVVNAAGTDACGTLGEVSAEEWEHVVAVNLLGTVAVTRSALPHLRASEGTIVNCASTLGLRALSDATAYCASKFGVVGFTRALAAELAGTVGVTLLVPGGMRTAFFDDRPEQYKPGPDAKLNDPADVASTVLMALRQPRGCEIREMVVCPSMETSWP
ncbi:SDR family oxidoreductase [Nocardiopsis sp. L17-MgMaSL7]|jgi:NAD(P)-dependent dehydrogenase (short-subunit alcohol dehydrogenase family)|uniref:SDR family oxidoreductase n=1 Tax=Nocardiopsis sp. L17-MgMaSL7 TaxID=1938893 RepID=UPI000D71792E|nr:SDR family oxidoreductase [Nocardiopsis sp. L17-MgMaSL7]PWV55429.1 NADP-dependent 3-hydroxy acid dehydrogenase YdfG [Nocardiopsis sp. L17-MgMaSL7]